MTEKELEVVEILKNVLSVYRRTVENEWECDVFKSEAEPEVQAALKWLKENGIEIEEKENN